MIEIDRLAWKQWLALLSLLSATFPASAQPIVVAPDGTGTVVTPTGDRFDISGGSLSGDKANLFHSFSQFGLNEGQTANFLVNPHIRNVLGRINGGEASLINGLIQITGGNSNLFLMNPAGIIFGPNASLNIPASFTATTATGIGFENHHWFNAIGNNQWANLIGNPSVFAFNAPQLGAIVNAGNLTVPTGETLTLMGGTVFNTGQLSASSGNIIISAVPGQSLVRLHQQGHLLNLEILPIATPNYIPNSWTQPILSLPQLLTGKGLEHATGLTVDGKGHVVLTGNLAVPAEDGIAIASGSLDVSGMTGGTVHILGNKVAAIATQIDASGVNGGGRVLIGGDYQGLGTIPNASFSFVSQDSLINANTLVQGPGGRVIVWADDTTRFYGKITATGGSVSGNGGFAEVSGKQNLDFQGLADLRSPSGGQVGTLLLDPTDITISAAPNSANMTFGDGIFSDITTSVSNLNINTLQNQLGFGDVIVDTSPIGTSFIPPAPTILGNIVVNDPISWNSGFSLTLRADNNIIINSSINNLGQGAIALDANSNIVINRSLATNGGFITLTADADNNSIGAITITNTAPIVTGGGNFTALAANEITVNSNLTTSGGNIYLDTNSSNGFAESALTISNSVISTNGGDFFGRGRGYNKDGISIANSTLNTASGNITLNGLGGLYDTNSGILVDNSSLVTTTGNITFEAQSPTLALFGPVFNFYRGLVLDNNSSISTGDGNIKLTGIGGGGDNGNNQGIVIQNSSAVRSTGAGSIALIGTGGTTQTGSNNTGIFITLSGQVESTGSGNITLTGTGGNSNSNNGGIKINQGASITSALGEITLNGVGGNGTGQANYGVGILEGGSVQSTGPGGITIEGKGGTGTDANVGILLSGSIANPTPVINTASGNITLLGTSGVGTNSNAFLFENNATLSSLGGAIALTSTNSDLDFSNGTLNSSSSTGNGGPISITATGNLIAGNLNSSSVSGAAGEVQLTSPLSISISAIDANGLTNTGNITLTSEQLNFNGTTPSIQSKGTLSIAPYNLETQISIGTPTGNGLSLDNAFIASLQNGFSGITLGHLKGTGNIVIDSPNPSITFSDPVTVQTQGSISVNTPLVGTDNAALTLKASTLNLNSNAIANGSDITITGNIVLGNSVLLNTSSGSISGNLIVNGTIDGSHDLTLQTNPGTGNITLNGAVGGITPLNTLSLNSNGSIQTEAITVANLVQTGNGNATFQGAIATTGADGITLSGTSFLFNADVITASNSPLIIQNSGPLTLNASTFKLGGSFNQIGSGPVSLSGNLTTSNSNISFTGPVTLTGNTAVNAGSSSIAFSSNLNTDSHPLSLTAGEIDFLGGNGSVAGSNTLTISQGIAGGNLVIGGNVDSNYLDLTSQDINALQNGFNSITLQTTSNSTISIVGSTSFQDPIVLQNPGGLISINSPLLGTDDASLTLNANTTLLNSNLSTNGYSISFNSNAILGNLVTLQTNGGNLTFNGTVDGNYNLNIDTGSGITTFNFAVGNSSPLGNGTGAAISLNSLGATLFQSTLTTNSGILATGPIAFSDNVDLRLGDTPTVFESSLTLPGIQLKAANGVTFENVTLTTGPVSILSADGDITFNGTLTGLQPLTINSGTGNITFNNSVKDLQSLLLDGQNIAINSPLQVVDSLTLTSIGNTNLLGNITISSGSATFNHAGILNLSSDLNLGGSFIQNGTGNVSASGNITTANGNITFNSPVYLIGDTQLRTSGNNQITLGQSVDGAANLTLQADQGNITFAGAVGSETPLNNLIVTNASGNLQISTTAPLKLAGTFQQNGTGAVNVGANITTNNQDIRFQGPVTLTVPVTLSPGNGAIAFGSSLNVGNHPLTLTASEIDFGRPISGSNTLVLQAASPTQNIVLGDGNNSTPNLDLTASDLNAIQPGFTALTIGQSDSNGNITLANPVVFNIPVTIQTGGGTIALDRLLTADGNASINLKASTIDLKAGITTNNANLAIAGNLNLGADVTLSSLGGISITGPIEGPHSLTLNAGNLRLQGDIGGTSPLARLEMNASTTDLGGNVASSGDIAFNSAVLLTKDARLTTQSGNITFGSTLDSLLGNANLNLAAGSGEIRFNGAVGTQGPLGNLAIESAGNITATSTVNAMALQLTSTGIVNLQGNVTTNSASITAEGDLTVSQMAVKGGPLTLTTQKGNLTTGDLDTSSASSQGGAIALNSPAGIITTGNLTSSGLSGGNISVMALLSIATGRINSRGTQGSGGNVFLDPIGDIQVEWIDAQGGPGGNGGSVDITTGNFFRAVGSFTDQQGITASISTVGGTGGGPITIRHAGGNGGPPIQPFIVGDAGINGTAGAITSGSFTLQSQSFPDSFTLGDIGIVTDNAIPDPQPSPSPPPSETPTPQPSPVLPLPSETPTPQPSPILSTPSETPTPQPSPALPIPVNNTFTLPPEAPLAPEFDFTLRPTFNVSAIPAIGWPIEIPDLGPIPATEEAASVIPSSVTSELFGPMPSKLESRIAIEGILSPEVGVTEVAIDPPNTSSPIAPINTLEEVPSPSLSETSRPLEFRVPNLTEFQRRSLQSLETPSFSPDSVLKIDESITRHWPLDRQPLTNNRQGQRLSSATLPLPANPNFRPDTDSPSTDGNLSRKISPSSPSNSEKISPSESTIGYTAAIEKRLDNQEVEDTIWQIEQLRNQEFEQHFGMSFNASTDKSIAVSVIQDSLRKIDDQTGKKSAIIYIISRQKSLEIILVPALGKPLRYLVPEANRAAIEPVVVAFRTALTTPRKRQTDIYKTSAKQLYQWLIKPLEKDLQNLGIETLLLSLDPGLRSLPMAALYDGKQFLIEKYNLSLVPSFSLTDTRYSSMKDYTILAMGASEFTDQHPLPAVPTELQSIALEWQAKSFLNADFTLENFEKQRSQNEFRIVHLATHAEFLSGKPRNSYIQFWKDKLYLDRMPSLNWTDPLVELLVLSACKTALGDREAELGFAGLAVQSGVRSALASLWYVDDVATMGLMSEFYEQLRDAATKGEALRKAQIAMLSGKVQLRDGQLRTSQDRLSLPPTLSHKDTQDFTHPYYWSAFTLIGNPW